jgi:hypothetical protein
MARRPGVQPTLAGCRKPARRPAERLKALHRRAASAVTPKSSPRSPRPLSYLLVYGTAKIETSFEAVVDQLMRIMGLMAEQPIPESHRPHVAERARAENRVILRVTP